MRILKLSLFAVLSLAPVACSQQAASEPVPTANQGAAPAAGQTVDPDGQTANAAVETEQVIPLGPENAQIQFTGTHVGEKPDPRVGVFTMFQGQAKLSADGKSLESVSVEIHTDSIATQFPKLTNHLKSPDFFDARQFPTAKFESTKISPASGGGGSHMIAGKLTLLDTTKELSFPATVTIADGKLTIDGRFTLDRTAYGMDKLTDRVNKEVEINATIGKKTETPKPAAAQ